ncbi:unnamed protein product, partial [Symbiodinium pilosum]
TEWFSEWPPQSRSLAPGRKQVADILAREVERLGDASKVFLGGSSQGCILGLDVFVRSPHDLGGFCGILGYWPRCSNEALASMRPQLKLRPVQLVNGQKDTVVNCDEARASFQELRTAGMTLNAIEVAKMDHHAGEAEGQYLRIFLEKVLPGPQK